MRKLRIESPVNERFKTWKQCLKASGIEKHGQFLVSGPKIIAEELRLRPELYTDLIFRQEFSGDLAVPDSIQIVELAAKLFEELNESATPGPILVGNKPQWPVFDPISTPHG